MLALELAQFIPLIIIIGYASYKDIKTKHVPNKTWLYAIYGVTLTILSSLTLSNTQIQYETASITFAIGIAYLLFLVKAWGGADAKALMTIGLSAPLFPTWTFFNKAPTLLSFFPIGVFYIACLSTIIYTIINKTKEPLKQRKIQFMPFLLIGLIICVII